VVHAGIYTGVDWTSFRPAPVTGIYPAQYNQVIELSAAGGYFRDWERDAYRR
jgi:hypothetical protein